MALVFVYFPVFWALGPRDLCPVGHLMPDAHWGFALSFFLSCSQSLFFLLSHSLFFLLSYSLFFVYFPVF